LMCALPTAGSRPHRRGLLAMSEYQYYEFVAIDQPLSADEQADLCAISTRALITPTSFVNHYDLGVISQVLR
jgi:hypothetical protein